MNVSSPAAGRRELARSHAYCEEVARRHAGNFYPAFRLLPADQRRALCALYAFLRVADDIADAPGPGYPDAPGPACARAGPLEEWRAQLRDALGGVYRHRLHPALHHTIARFGVPPRHLEEVLDGVAMDLTISHYDTFEDLYQYCYRVASAVGLSCIHVWGFAAAQAAEYAEAAGIALQLTNILRDLGEDAGRGRVYLPREDLERFGYPPEGLAQGRCDGAFRALMRFEVERARGYYARAEALAPLLRPAGRAVFLVMLRTYRGLLDAIEGRGYDVFRRRVRLPAWKKLWLAARALPVRWGWA
jgi:phytoene synthase